MTHRLRRWPNIKTTLAQHVVFAGLFFGDILWSSLASLAILNRLYDATRCTPGYRCTPEYRVICSATWSIRRQFVLQQTPTLKDVLSIVLSDENDSKTRIFCKRRTFQIYFCPLLKLFYTFCYPGYSLEK